MRKALLFLFLILAAAESIASDGWKGRVVTVIDGTTLDIAKPDGKIQRVKLYAVSASTTDNLLGDAARKRTASWCHQWGDVAEVRPMRQEAEGLLFARVLVGEDDLADVLTKDCLAKVDLELCKKNWFPECVGWHAWELQCRDEKKGIWATNVQ